MRDLERVTGRIVVCAPTTLPAFFADDRHGTCAICGQAVRFRPSTPAPRTLVCLLCFVVKAEPDEVCEILGDVPTC
jgi:hypothetical protein